MKYKLVETVEQLIHSVIQKKVCFHPNAAQVNSPNKLQINVCFNQDRYVNENYVIFSQTWLDVHSKAH